MEGVEVVRGGRFFDVVAVSAKKLIDGRSRQKRWGLLLGLHPYSSLILSRLLARKDTVEKPNVKKKRKRGARRGARKRGSAKKGEKKSWGQASSRPSSPLSVVLLFFFSPSSSPSSPLFSLSHPFHSQLVRENARRDRRAVVAAPADEHDSVFF